MTSSLNCSPEIVEVFEKWLKNIGDALSQYGIVRSGTNHLLVEIEASQNDEKCLNDIEMLCGKDACDLVSEQLEDFEWIHFIIEIGYGMIGAENEYKFCIVAFCYVDDNIRFPLYKFENGLVIENKIHYTQDLGICSVISEAEYIDAEYAEKMAIKFSQNLNIYI